jgi:hypothetical protein
LKKFFKGKNSIPMYLSLMTVNLNLVRFATDIVHMREIYSWDMWSNFMQSLKISPYFALMEIMTLVIDGIFIAFWFKKFLQHDTKTDNVDETDNEKIARKNQEERDRHKP